MIRFRYRQRRGEDGFHLAYSGVEILLVEGTDYVIEFPHEPTPAETLRIKELGADFLTAQIAVLNFKNYVGKANLASVPIRVVSHKVGEEDVSALLEEVSELSSALIFAWRTPVMFEASGKEATRSPVPYHQLQFLRHTVLLNEPGSRLQDWLYTIERHPTRKFASERPFVSISRVKKLDAKAIQGIASRIDRLVPISDDSNLALNPTAQKLTFGTPPRAHFPNFVSVPQGRLTYDTHENRFVRYVVRECLGLAYRFVAHPKLAESFKADIRYIISILESHLVSPVLLDTEAALPAGAPSQALTKSDGYREMFVFWQQFTRHTSLPMEEAETVRLLEGRDMAGLYEYWVFAKVIEALASVVGVNSLPPYHISRTELGEALTFSVSPKVPTPIAVHYNLSYSRSKGAYSTPLRPDVIVEVDGVLYAFDAKYRLERFEVSDIDTDDGGTSYKRADLYKMHTYRDAINNLKAAFVVYPGANFVFFQRDGSKVSDPCELKSIDGVGAIPLRPGAGNPAPMLEGVLSKLLNP